MIDFVGRQISARTDLISIEIDLIVVSEFNEMLQLVYQGTGFLNQLQGELMSGFPVEEWLKGLEVVDGVTQSHDRDRDNQSRDGIEQILQKRANNYQKVVAHEFHSAKEEPPEVPENDSKTRYRQVFMDGS